MLHQLGKIYVQPVLQCWINWEKIRPACFTMLHQLRKKFVLTVLQCCINWRKNTSWLFYNAASTGEKIRSTCFTMLHQLGGKRPDCFTMLHQLRKKYVLLVLQCCINWGKIRPDCSTMLHQLRKNTSCLFYSAASTGKKIRPVITWRKFSLGGIEGDMQSHLHCVAASWREKENVQSKLHGIAHKLIYFGVELSDVTRRWFAVFIRCLVNWSRTIKRWQLLTHSGKSLLCRTNTKDRTLKFKSQNLFPSQLNSIHISAVQ